MKPVLAFVAGIIVAGGVAYFASSNHESEPAPIVASTPAVTSASAPEPAAPAEAAPAPAPVSQPVAEAPPPVKHKPILKESKRPAPWVTASRQSPPPAMSAPAPVAQAPAPAPVSAPPPPQEEARVSPPPPIVASIPDAPRPEPRKPSTVTIPAGTLITVRLEEALSTDRSFQGDQFRATLDQPIIVDHMVIAERGSRTLGKVVDIDKGGKVKGLAQLGIELVSLNTSDGQKVQLTTERFVRTADSNKKTDAAKVGGGAALGAIIGAIAGGGKGAAIGAGVGGAAGAGDVALTRGKAAQLPVETRVSFRLREPITITERLH